MCGTHAVLEPQNPIQGRLKTLYPDCEVEILGMTTRGDQILDRTLSKVGGKGLFVKELEQRITEIKHNDQRRHDYMIMTAFEADAKRMGRLEGRQEGIAQGEARGFADGAYQTKLETAKLMKNANCELDFIMQMTGLSQEEVESIN